MEVVILVHEDEAAHLAQAPHAMAALLEGQRQWIARIAERVIDGGRLQPTGGLELAQFYWLRVATMDEATALARELPVLDSDELEVRPVHAGLRGVRRRGLVFAFVVRGRDAVMDLIDEETRGALQAAPFVGGVRLQAAVTGRRIAKRAVIDAPFVEGREVIGGVFCLRMAGLSEAREWAAASRYVVHGTLEVRERWT